MLNITESDEKRFFDKIDKTKTCWIWIGARKVSDGKKTYGNFWHDGAHMNAHKFSAIMHGVLTDLELKVLHTCDNNACVNPEHLYQGTLLQNSQDAVERNRYNPWRRGMEVCDRGHKMTEENIKNNAGRKRCKACLYLNEVGLRYRNTGHRPNQARVIDKLAKLGYSVDKMIEEFGQPKDGE